MLLWDNQDYALPWSRNRRIKLEPGNGETGRVRFSANLQTKYLGNGETGCIGFFLRLNPHLPSSSSSSSSSTPAMSKRVRILTAEDVSNHNDAKSCWISRDGKVYDVTAFLPDHPGGDDLILKYAGKDVGEIMKDPSEHEHSDSAYDMLDDFVIGRLGTGEAIVSDGMCIFPR